MPASDSQGLKELYEFGPFQVDPEKEILLRAGEPVPITPKTFQILLVLIRHNKEVVTKDDLMKAVWPDTFVEEANLSRNIFLLRKALGESPQDHQYVLTVPGRGYRMAESVRLVPEQELSIVAANRSRVEVQVAETKPWGWLSAVAVLLVALGAGVTWLLLLRKPVLSEKDTVVLADFSNSTGDPVFNETLRQGMAVQLEQSPFLSLISEQRIHHTLKLMGRASDAHLTPEVAAEICKRTGSAAVLEGSIAKLGSEYVLGLQAKSCRSGNVLADEVAQAKRKEDVLTSLSQMAASFRKRIGESMATIQQHDTPLADATTSSLEALEAYTEGLKVHFSSGAIAALPFFQRAVDFDPNFAMAHSYLGRMYANLDESDLAARSIRKAWELRDRVSDREKFEIITRYDALVTGNLEQTRETSEAWIRTYPRDPQPHIGLALYYDATGQYEKAAAESQKAAEIDPDFSIAYSGLAADDVDLDRLDGAENAIQRAAGRGLETDEFIMVDYDVAFLKGDQAGMDRAVQQAQERSGGANWISNKQAFTLAYGGHLQQASLVTDRAVLQAQQASQAERASLWEAGAALRQALFGNAPQAVKRAAAALALSHDREAEYGAALAMAFANDSQRAETLASDLEKRFPEDTAVRFSYLPVLRAQLALGQHDAAKAVSLLEVAAPDELGMPRSSIHGLFGALYPVYVRGEAYMAQLNGTAAAAEFQKITDDRSIVVSDPIGALAHLQLARALSLSGDRAKARSEYQKLLALWRNADPDIPILKQAKDEYAKLN